MSDTQLDRIENMLKILISANTSLRLKGTTQDSKNLRVKVENYEHKTGVTP